MQKCGFYPTAASNRNQAKSSRLVKLASLGFLLLCIMSVVDLISVALDLNQDLTSLYSPLNNHTVPWLCDLYLILREEAQNT